MKKRFVSLRVKVFIVILAIILIIAGAFTFFAYKDTKNILTNQISQINRNTLIQMGYNVDFLLDEVHDISILLIQNQKLIEALKSERAITPSETQLIYKDLYAYIGQKYNVHSIYIEGENILFNTFDAENHITTDMRIKAGDLNGYYYWTPDIIMEYQGSTEEVFSLVRKMNDINNISDSLGIIKINVRKSAFLDILESKNNYYGGQFFIVDNNGNYIVDDISESLKVDFTSVDFDSINKLVSYNLNDYTFSVYPIKNTDYYLCNVVDNSSLFSDIYLFQKSIILGSLIGIVIALVILFLFDIQFLSPLKKLKTVMTEVENENFDVQISTNSNDEIGLVLTSFNKMSRKLNQLLKEVYQKEIKKKEAELMALQSQINPHFLYNTLDMIYWNTRLEKAYKSSELVHALSIHFRNTLNQGEFFTTLRKEIEHCNSYLTIQKERIGKLNYTIECEETLLDKSVVNLILVTLVENSIIHGFRDKAGECSIEIKIYEEENYIIYEIEDNGSGCDEDLINKYINEPKHEKAFALRNINERIHLAFNEEYNVELISEIGEGTKVIIKQPIGENTDV